MAFQRKGDAGHCGKSVIDRFFPAGFEDRCHLGPPKVIKDDADVQRVVKEVQK